MHQLYATILTAKQVHQRLQDATAEDNLVLLDIREPMEWAVEGYIEEAVKIPMNEIPSRLDDLPKDAEIIVYCHIGQRSAYVGAWLKEHGFENVYDLAGGIEAWHYAGLPVLRG